MTESEFLDLTDRMLETIQNAIDEAGLDADYTLNGGVLDIAFDNGQHIVVNRHGPNQEMWLAARSGGFHFAHDGTAWRNTRGGSDFWETLTLLVEEASGEEIAFER
ncbi:MULTISPECIES: iron donor protein CyaY [Gulbenkiania]|uniref:Iron-sulfur cluster assembly protein CyaY n=2 Tax=Gulbenkiania TaxID=397456 RepID=A0A0K6GWV4_9NEIS|nr:MULTISPECIES: iron donor protein CyaY [Gulbenkiania]TCW33094.1 CyaY protein [Gulbenkiania mobilis]CUA83079.1 iron donor protein CyaY [Gulbenkiania indica]